jgi:hypothetical protein
MPISTAMSCCPPPVAPLGVPAAQLIDLQPGDTWTPASAPAGHEIISVTAVILAGSPTTAVTDAHGTVVDDLPTGWSTTWAIADPLPALVAPQSISAGDGRVTVTVVTRPI